MPSEIGCLKESYGKGRGKGEKSRFLLASLESRISNLESFSFFFKKKQNTYIQYTPLTSIGWIKLATCAMGYEIPYLSKGKSDGWMDGHDGNYDYDGLSIANHS